MQTSVTESNKPAIPTKRVQQVVPLPDGWWAVDSKHKGHKGMKDLTAGEIESDQKIPAHWKAALLAEIKARNCQALEVHAHCQDEAGNLIISIHIKPLF